VQSDLTRESRPRIIKFHVRNSRAQHAVVNLDSERGFRWPLLNVRTPLQNAAGAEPPAFGQRGKDFWACLYARPFSLSRESLTSTIRSWRSRRTRPPLVADHRFAVLRNPRVPSRRSIQRTHWLSKGLKHKDVTYMNLLAKQKTLPLLNLRGFSKCTSGQLATISLLSGGRRMLAGDWF
jgi:hypothetical protein